MRFAIWTKSVGEPFVIVFSNLKKQYKEQGEAVRNSYREALPELTSWEFWNDYLGTDLMPNNASKEK